MNVDAQDIELLETYLDHELSDEEARALDARLADDPSLQKALDRLRSHRSLRFAAMSRSFESDAAAVERLVASVRAERATEALSLRRRFSPVRSVFAAAACVAFGLILGVAIQRQQTTNGLVASPAASMSSFLNSSVGFEAHGAYVVSLMNASGQEVMKVRFHSQEHARQFMERFNKQGTDGRTLSIGDATILQEEPY